MKISLLVLLFFFNTAYSLEGVLPFKSPICEKKALEYFSKYEKPLKWMKLPSVESDVEVYKSPTDRIGYWYKIKQDKTELTILRESALSSSQVSFSKSCIEKTFFTTKKIKSGFADSDVSELLEKSKSAKSSGLIYVWSAQMPLSVNAIKDISRVAKELEIPLTVLLESDTNIDIAAKMLKEYELDGKLELKANQSYELKARLGTLHYPALFAYSKGKLVRSAFVGAESYVRYKEYVERILKTGIRDF